MTVNIRTNDYPLRAKKKHQYDIECAEQVMIKALLVCGSRQCLGYMTHTNVLDRLCLIRIDWGIHIGLKKKKQKHCL